MWQDLPEVPSATGALVRGLRAHTGDAHPLCLPLQGAFAPSFPSWVYPGWEKSVTVGVISIMSIMLHFLWLSCFILDMLGTELV